RAVLRLPLAPLEASVDRGRPAFREVLGAVLALLAPHRHVEVVRLVDPLARLVLAARVDRHAQRADGGPRRRVPELRVASQVPDENDAIDVAGHLLLLLFLDLGCALGIVARGRSHRYRPGGTALDPTCRHVPHDAVVDPQHPRDLVERVRLAREVQQVVAALALVVDLVGEPSPAPGIVQVPAPAGLLDQLLHAGDDLALPGLVHVRVDQPQDFVLVYGFPSSFLRSHSASSAWSRRERAVRMRGRKPPQSSNGRKRSCASGTIGRMRKLLTWALVTL